MRLLYLVGAPGVGKSTLMHELTRGCDRTGEATPLRHDRLIDPWTGHVVAVELGARRLAFSGTDALALNIAPVAAAWMRSGAGALVLAEGDRLAHRGFFEAAAGGGYTVTVAYLTAAPASLEHRLRQRATVQDGAWRRGRATKAARMAAYAEAEHELVRLNADEPPEMLVRRLRRAVAGLGVLPAVRRSLWRGYDRYSRPVGAVS